MASKTKAQLLTENNANFPNNNSGFITPEKLRTYNADVVDSTVNQEVYTTDSASFDSRIGESVVTASLSGDTITFEKDNGSTFDITIQGATLPSGVISGSSQVILTDTTGNLGGNRITGSVASATLATNATYVNVQPNSINSNYFPAFTNGTGLNTTVYIDTTGFNYNPGLNRLTISSVSASAVTASVSVTAPTFFGDLDGNAVTATNATSASYAVTASYALNVPAIETGSFATTGSNTFIGNQTINGDLNVSGSIRAYEIHTTIESSSVIFSSGSNVLGDASNDVQTLNGSVRVVNELTASGLNYPTADNGEFSFIQTDGVGNLSLQYVHTMYDVIYAGENIVKGDPVYVSGSNGANPIVWKADASDSTKAAIYISADTINAGSTGRGITLGEIEGIDLTGIGDGQNVYLAEGGGWSTSRPSGSNSIVQALGIVTKGGSGGKGVVLNPGPATLPNIQEGYAWVGNSGNQPTSVSTASWDSHTDITSLNQFTASQEVINTDTANKFDTIGTQSGSWATQTDITNLNAFTASQEVKNSTLETYTSSVDSTLTTLTNASSSFEEKFTTIGTQSGSWSGGGTDLTSLNTFTASQELLNTTFATTGSNSYIGDQSVTGAITASKLVITGGAGTDVSVTGTLQTTLGIFPNGGVLTGAAGGLRTFAGDYGFYNGSGSNNASIGITIDNLGYGNTGWDGPALWANDPTDSYPALIGFQKKENWTDGTVTILKNTNLSGSLDIQNTLTASLQEGYVWVGDSLGRTTTVSTGSFGGGGGAAFPYTGDAQISGSLGVTGSMSGYVNTLSIASLTASVDFNDGNMFLLTLASSADTHINPTNIKAGQTINIQITQPATSGSISFAPNVLFAGGADYQVTATGSAVDLLTLVSFDGTNVLATSIKNFQ